MKNMRLIIIAVLACFFAPSVSVAGMLESKEWWDDGFQHRYQFGTNGILTIHQGSRLDREPQCMPYKLSGSVLTLGSNQLNVTAMAPDRLTLQSQTDPAARREVVAPRIEVTVDSVIGVWHGDYEHTSDALALGTNGQALYLPDTGVIPARWESPDKRVVLVSSVPLSNYPSRVLCKGYLLSSTKMALDGHPVSQTWTRREFTNKVTAFEARIRMLERRPDASRRLIESRTLETNANQAVVGTLLRSAPHR